MSFSRDRRSSRTSAPWWAASSSSRPGGRPASNDSVSISSSLLSDGHGLAQGRQVPSDLRLALFQRSQYPVAVGLLTLIRVDHLPDVAFLLGDGRGDFAGDRGLQLREARPELLGHLLVELGGQRAEDLVGLVDAVLLGALVESDGPGGQAAEE